MSQARFRADGFLPLAEGFFENGAAAFQPKARPNQSAEQERIDHLGKKIQTKDEVLAELMAEHVALKGGIDRSLEKSQTKDDPKRSAHPLRYYLLSS